VQSLAVIDLLDEVANVACGMRKFWTNDPLEPIMKKIRRQPKVIGAFAGRQSCLNLAASRLRHIAGNQ